MRRRISLGSDRSRQGRLRARPGIALAIALTSIVLASTLVAGALYVGTQNSRLSTNGRRVQASFGLAETGIGEAIRNWNPASYNSRAFYPLDSVTLSRTASGTGVYAGRIYKLNDKLYFVDITGNDSASLGSALNGGGARQRIGVLTRVLPLNVDLRAALTIGGPVVFGGGNVFIDGSDHVPPSWANCVTDTAIAGVRAKAAGDVQASQGQVTGHPNVLITPTMDSTTFINYGSATYSQLAANANITLAAGTYSPNPVIANGVCTLGNNNWGDGKTPTSACGTYFPIVHITGDATITNGTGQGILLVDGNLIAAGTFTYYGLVIIRGGFSTVAGGNPKVYGSVLAQSINLATTAFAGDAVIDYSTCPVRRAMDATGMASLVRSRSWVRMM